MSKVIRKSISMLSIKSNNGDGRELKKLSTMTCISLIINKMIGTGIFSTPSIIYEYCGGNITLFISSWIIGAIITFCGLFVYLEYAMNLPISNGGEKNYLLRIIKKPKGLAGCAYAFVHVILGFSSGNSYAFGEYLLYSLKGNEEELPSWEVKMVGVLCISFCTYLNICFPNHGTTFFNILGVMKIFILILIICTGCLVYLGILKVDSESNTNLIVLDQSGRTGVYYLASALLEVIYSFKGWENANYILQETLDPYHVLTIAAPSAVIGASSLYLLIVVSYLIVIPKDEMINSGVLVAGVFFTKVFGEGITSCCLPLMISLSNLGNVMVVSFSHSYVIEDLARNNYLPYSKYFSKITYAILLHWLVTVLVLIIPPSSGIYEFIINISVYPGTWFNVLIAGGLFYLRANSEKEQWGAYTNSSNLNSYNNQNSESLSVGDSSEVGSEIYTEFDSLLSVERRKTFSVPLICIVTFFLANTFLAIFPFIPPPKTSYNPEGTIPFWAFPVFGTLVLLLGVFWFYCRKYAYKWYFKDKDTSKINVKYENDYISLNFPSVYN